MESNLNLVEEFEQSIFEDFNIKMNPDSKLIFSSDIYWSSIDDDSPIGSDIGHDSFFAYLRVSNNEPNQIKAFLETLKHMDLLKIYVSEISKLRPNEIPEFIQDNMNLFKLLTTDRAIISICFAQIIKSGTMSDDLLNIFFTAMARQVHPPTNIIICNNIESKIKKRGSFLLGLFNRAVELLKKRD